MVFIKFLAMGRKWRKSGLMLPVYLQGNIKTAEWFEFNFNFFTTKVMTHLMLILIYLPQTKPSLGRQYNLCILRCFYFIINIILYFIFNYIFRYGKVFISPLKTWISLVKINLDLFIICPPLLSKKLLRTI